MSKKVNLFFKFLIYAIFFLFAGFILIFSIQQVFAQEISADEEARLRSQLEQVEREIVETANTLNQQKVKSANIEGKVNALKSEINAAQAVINQKVNAISRLGSDIELKEQTVEQLNDKMERSKQTLSELLRTTNQLDDISLPEIILAYDNISDFFSVVDTLVVMQKSLDQLFDQIRELRGLTEEEKQQLEEKKAREADAKAEVERQKNQVAVKKSEQDNLLAVSKSVEKTYQQILAEKQAQASAIRSAIFRLRDTTNITFGEALNFARQAEKSTGVSSAFIMAILQQESNIGQNVGSCVITDLQSGSTRNVNNGSVSKNGIHPTRDLPVLQQILTTLGKDPLETKISCPLNVGYGGAMGPSQFIPSTWKMYMPTLQNIFGVFPDPWNPEHAITGTGLLLRDNGAASRTYSAEHTAAAKYYAGGNWATYGQSYANQVMSKKAALQKQIDTLTELENY